MAYISPWGYIPEHAWDDIFWVRAGISFCAIRPPYCLTLIWNSRTLDIWWCMLCPRSPSKLWLSSRSGIQSSSLLAWLGLAYYPPTLSFLLICSYPCSWSHSPTCFMFCYPLCFMFPVPDPNFWTPNPEPCSVPPHITFPLFYFCFLLLFLTYACFPWPWYVLFNTYTVKGTPLFYFCSFLFWSPLFLSPSIFVHPWVPTQPLSLQAALG